MSCRYLAWADINLLNRNYNCPVQYSGASGEITSHEGYPDQPYDVDYRHRWYLAVEEGHRIRLEWLDFRLENPKNGALCKYDYVAVLDGSGEVGPTGGREPSPASAWEPRAALLRRRHSACRHQPGEQVAAGRRTG
jgi:hypothetical protein